jgi:hypothetical protein
MTIGPSSIVAVRLDRAVSDEIAAVEFAGLEEQSDGEALRTAFQTIAESLDAPPGSRCFVALLPPLVELRILMLPPLHDDQMARALSQNARRYFVSCWDSPVIGARRIDPARGQPGRVLVAAAQEDLVQGIYEACAHMRWRLRSLSPAHTAWVASLVGADPANNVVSQPGVIAILDSSIEILHVEQGLLTGLRRIPVGSGVGRLTRLLAPPQQDKAQVEGAISQERPIVVIGPQTERQSVRRELESVTVGEGGAAFEVIDEGEPIVLAARWASRTSGPRLVSHDVRLSSARRARRASLVLAGTSVAFLGLSALTENIGLKRELDAITARRAAMAPTVRAAVIQGEDLVERVERMVALAELERDASRWSTVLPEIAEHLPGSAHLQSLTGHADTLLLAGSAERAASVFEELQRVPGLERLEALGPIRREEGEDGTREVFALSADLRDPVP